ELESLAGHPDVLSIQTMLTIESIIPQKTGITYSSLSLDISSEIPSNLEIIGAPQAWELGLTGEGSVICSFDTGVDGLHPALFDSWKGHDGDSSAAWYDPFGKEPFPHFIPEAGPFLYKHGTHTMGTMVGHDDNTGDTIGVAPGAKWISAAVINLPYPSIIDAFEWAADPDGDPNTFDDVPDVINHSWGAINELAGCDDYLWELIDNTEALGIINIFSAGNEGLLPQTIANPANRANDSLDCFAVGNFNHWTSSENKIDDNSARGPSDCDGVSIKPNVVAPGTAITSSVPDGDYDSMNGTSMAAPHV
ncbi:MAG: S8 family serine peptidase, partial [Planctomycetes bacterium]|nr:S8 family serine peptidase [Planctomycetota bacterium]